MRRRTSRNEAIFCDRATRGHGEKKGRWSAKAPIELLLVSSLCSRRPRWLKAFCHEAQARCPEIFLWRFGLVENNSSSQFYKPSADEEDSSASRLAFSSATRRCSRFTAR